MGLPADTLLGLGHRARHAASLDELAFLAVNDTHALTPYRQAALWLAEGGIRSLSGVIQIEANAPYVHWLGRVCGHLQGKPPGPVSLADLPEAEAAEWSEWLPVCGLWLPFPGGGCLLAREEPWHDGEISVLAEWFDTWHHAWLARQPPIVWSWQRVRQAILDWLLPHPGQRWWQQRRIRVLTGIVAVLLFPVRLTVLAPGELVPANPAVIRAPLDGVIAGFLVKPNDSVQANQPLFAFDSAVLASRHEVAAQALVTAEAEYRQAAQQALSDIKSKALLALITGKIEEKRAEADYLHDQLNRAQVVAPIEGIALFDDPVEWIGKPVLTGERILRIAAPGDIEVEAWISLGDAIPLEPGAPVSLYLSAAPLSSISAQIRYVAHEAMPRPDGSYAYRVRASLEHPVDHRVGLKGTSKLYGRWVPLSYWMLRRPLATLRQFLGL